MLNFDFAKSSVMRPPILEHGAVSLRAAEPADYGAWLALRQESRAHLTRWEPDWRDQDVTAEAFRARIRNYERQHRSRVGLSLYAYIKATGDLVGGVTLSDIRFQSSHSATIGYWIGERFLRRGHGLAAVEAVVAHAFLEMRLNRVEAACQPGNLASKTLLSKAGFREEGFVRDYLFINGSWRDHLLFALTARDYCGAPTLPYSMKDVG